MRTRTSIIRIFLAALAVATPALTGASSAHGQILPDELSADGPARRAAPGGAGEQDLVAPDAGTLEGGFEEPDENDWDALSKDVIAKFTAANYTLVDNLNKFRTARCLVDVTIGGSGMRPLKARYLYGWSNNDADNEIIGAEIELNQRSISNSMATRFMLGPERRLENQLQFDTLSLFKRSAVRTRKTTGGYTMTISPKPTEQTLAGMKLVLALTGDFRLTGMQVRYNSGTTARYGFTHKKVRGKWLTTGSTQSQIISTFQLTTSERYAYRWVDGVPFAAETLVQRVTNGQGMRLTNYERYVYGPWKTEKREAPAAENDGGRDPVGPVPVAGQDRGPARRPADGIQTPAQEDGPQFGG